MAFPSAPRAGVLPSSLSERWGSAASTAHQSLSGGTGSQSLYLPCCHRQQINKHFFSTGVVPGKTACHPVTSELDCVGLIYRLYQPYFCQRSSFISTSVQVRAKEADLCQGSQGASFLLGWLVCNLAAWRAYVWAWSRCPKWGLKWEKAGERLGPNYLKRKSLPKKVHFM